MRIIDLSAEYEPTFLACLKDWDEDAVGKCHKARWCDMMKCRGLRVKLALDDSERAVGMIQYVPIEYARAEGQGLYFIQCVWVHGYDEGMGNQQGRGAGRALLQAAEEDVQVLGAKGMVAWGLAFPHWMPAAWYEKQGYVEADRIGCDVLVWKPFSSDVQPPRWMRPRREPDLVPGRVTVTALVTGWCPGLSQALDARRAAAEFGDRVVFREIDTSDPAVLAEWGMESALFVDDECINTGLTDYPPPRYEGIRQKIGQKLEIRDEEVDSA
ncbi:MAG: GNAT family N-acetyltransferase [Anaerolineae bacterium]|nr:GNAT family N-acetyltransferase [Anaerolineae bacterium]